MSDTRKARLAALLTVTAALLLAFALGSIWPGAGAALALALLGWPEVQRKYERAEGGFLAGAVLLVTLGAWFALSPFLLLLALLGALAAWDLGRFEARLRGAAVDEAILALERRHLRLLGMALAGGGIASAAALLIRLPMGFGVALVLGVTLVFLLGSVFRLLYV